MSSVVPVPETASMTGDELTADDAWRTLRRCWWTVLREALIRFRYGDGFSHARALGLQLCLAVVPLVIALVGLSDTLHANRAGQVLRLVVVDLTPGASDDLVGDVLSTSQPGEDGGEVALWLGLIVALVALTTAMGQVERGANRIYGVQRDRPGHRKYVRALIMAGAAGVPAMAGFLLLLAGSTAGTAVERVYEVRPDAVPLVALPAGAALLLVSITAMLRHSPRRRQPGWSWLGLGAAVAVMLWLLFTGLLAGYVQLSDAFGAVYGPLTGVVALLLWSQLTSVAIFLALALTAQLEAVRVGRPRASGEPVSAGGPGPGGGLPARDSRRSGEGRGGP